MLWLSAAAAYALVFPKAQIAPLAFGFLVPLLLAIENKKPAARFRIFFCFSFASYLVILYWIPRVMVKYGGASWTLGVVGLVALGLYLSIFSGLAGMLIGNFLKNGQTLRAAFWVPAIWVAKDLAIENVLGGFPWCLAGYSQFKNLWFAQLAEVGGIHLVTFLLIAVNVLLFRLWKTKSGKTLLALLAVILASHAGGYWLLRTDAARAAAVPFHRAGIIQPNINHDAAFDFARIKATLERLFETSRQLKKGGAEFVVWPEFTVPIYPLQTSYFKERLVGFSRDRVPLFAGFTDYQGSEKVFNSMMLFNGPQIEKYDKVHLTPFGEYVLFRRLLFFVKKITDEIGDFTPGAGIHNIGLAGHRFATPICYEVIYPQLVRTMIAQGGEVVITISNDSWFGNSSAPYQHLAMAVFRCIENRRFLLRSTSDGISALVDPAGRIVYQSPLHESDQFIASFKYLRNKTIFTRWGYLFPYFCLLLVLARLMWLLAGKCRRRRT